MTSTTTIGMMMMTIANNYRKALVGSASDDQSPAWPAPAAPPYTLFLIFINIIIIIIIIIIIRLSEKSFKEANVLYENLFLGRS